MPAELATIVAKELAVLNRTVQLMSHITNRRRETIRESVALVSKCHCRQIGEPWNDYDDLEAQMTTTTTYTSTTITKTGARPFCAVADVGAVVGIQHMRDQFIALCALIDVDVVDVNAMTALDQPVTETSLDRQRCAQTLVTCCIASAFERLGACQVVHRLHDTSARAWNLMAYIAYYCGGFDIDGMA
jgi:hypothetical protein